MAQKCYWLRFKGLKTWHSVCAKNKTAAKKKFISGSKFKMNEVFSRKTSPYKKKK